MGSSGSHTVCVCSIHQNAKLLASACGMDYKDLMKVLVCDLASKYCMVHRCENCPGKPALVEKLRSPDMLSENEDIEFKQWEATDRTSLHTITMFSDDFIDTTASKLDALTSHSFIAKSKSQYLKDRKVKLQPNTAIVLADFSENYSYIVQDEVLGYHWNKEQCTLHPIVMYHGNPLLTTYSFCFLSDDLTHDVGFVYALQKKLTQYIHVNFPQINFIEYFLDGCNGQYKNYKNFLNLTYHKHDFGIGASWSLFATSHGKSPCDGIDGMVKRKLMQESLM